jgi:hypothetical protein
VPGQISEFAFEDWRFTIENGLVLPIPTEATGPWGQTPALPEEDRGWQAPKSDLAGRS